MFANLTNLKLSKDDVEFLYEMEVRKDDSLDVIYKKTVLDMEDGQLDEYIVIDGSETMNINNLPSGKESVSRTRRGSREWVVCLIRYYIAEKERLGSDKKCWIVEGKSSDLSTTVVEFIGNQLVYRYKKNNCDKFFSLPCFGLSVELPELRSIEPMQEECLIEYCSNQSRTVELLELKSIESIQEECLTECWSIRLEDVEPIETSGGCQEKPVETNILKSIDLKDSNRIDGFSSEHQSRECLLSVLKGNQVISVNEDPGVNMGDLGPDGSLIMTKISDSTQYKVEGTK